MTLALLFLAKLIATFFITCVLCFLFSPRANDIKAVYGMHKELEEKRRIEEKRKARIKTIDEILKNL